MTTQQTTADMLTDQVNASWEHWRQALDHQLGKRPFKGIPAKHAGCFICNDLGIVGAEDAFDVLNVMALSVEHTWTGTSRSNAYVTATTIVLATGGPHIEILSEYGQHLTVAGYWAGDRYSMIVEHDPTEALVAELEELAEMS